MSPHTAQPASRLRGASEAGAWERVAVPPIPSLRGLVARLQGYSQRMSAATVHRTMPLPGLPLILSLGPGHRIRTAQGEVSRLGSFLAGPHDRHVFVEATTLEGLQVDLTPLGAHRLLGRSLAELTNRVVAVEDVWGSAVERLLDDLAGLPDWETRLHRLQQELERRLAAGPGPDPRVAWAWGRLVASGGRVPVAALAQELGWSRRHLAGRFGEQLGLPPKRAARLIRFHHATRLLARPDGPPVAEVAAMVGCYDQAHLANEVRSHCGLSPTQLRARSLGDGGVWEVAEG